MYPRSFADSNGDGVGDIPGVLARLDHLEGLGVDVVWMSPVYRSPMDDNGYDISDYHDVDPLFGTLDDLDTLIDELHRRGMKLVMDLVVNHTSDEHPWFVASRSGRDSARRDWYWWRDRPNNWTSHFSGPAWTFDEASGQYYLHLFSPKQPDLNWENPEVRQAVYAMMRWWLDRGVDGFRMDVINMISKDPALPDTRRGHFVRGTRTHEFLQEMHREVFAGRPHHLLTVGEMPGVGIEEAVRLTDPANFELDMVFQFQHVSLDLGRDRFDPRPLKLVDLKASLAEWQTGLFERGWNSLYWGNHDQPRAVSRFGDDGRYRTEAAKTLATVLHLHRGTPFVYQGDELGMANAPFASISHFRDIETLNAYRQAEAEGRPQAEAVLEAARRTSRDHARTPVQWDDSPEAGFTTGTPWMAVNPDYTDCNAASQTLDPGSVYHHHRRLIALRHDDPVVTDGDFELLAADHPRLWAFLRRSDHGCLAVAANFSTGELPVDLGLEAVWGDAEVVIANLPDPPGSPTGTVVLRPWESVVWRLSEQVFGR